MIKEDGQQIAKLNKLWTCKLCEVMVFLALFVAIYLLNQWYSSLTLPPSWRQLLGRPPEMIHICVIFFLYSFSVVVLKGAAWMAGKSPDATWKHLGYRVGFVLFAACSTDMMLLFPLLITVCLGLYIVELGYIRLFLYQFMHPEIGNPT